MPTCLARGNDIAYTIMPYELDMPVEECVSKNRTDATLGYITHNRETGERKFIYTESGNSTTVTEHWSLNILKEFPYLEAEHAWVVYMCAPEDVRSSFDDYIESYHHTLHIYNWDIWTTEEKKGSVAVVTSYETY